MHATYNLRYNIRHLNAFYFLVMNHASTETPNMVTIVLGNVAALISVAFVCFLLKKYCKTAAKPQATNPAEGK